MKLTTAFSLGARTALLALAMATPFSAHAAQPKVVYVDPGSTLIQAARQLAPYANTDELSLWAVALYKLNPEAFIDGDIHRVRADFPLLVPNHKQRSEIDARQAILALRVPQRMRLSTRLTSLSGGDDSHAKAGSHHTTRTPRFSPFAKRARYKEESFKTDPVYPERQYSAEKQREIYGGKRAMNTARPLMELGYPLYKEGPLGSTHTWFGEKNLASPQFLVYGDSRLVLSGDQRGDLSRAQLAPQLNLDTDLKLTATERIHALFKPFEKDGKFTRLELNRDDNQDTELETEIDLSPATFFIEGDIAAIIAGKTN